MIATTELPARAHPEAVTSGLAGGSDERARIERLLQILDHIDAALEAELQRLTDRELDGPLVEALRSAHGRCRAPYLRQLADVGVRPFRVPIGRIAPDGRQA